MIATQKIPQFDLSGMEVDDWFLGCPSCYRQFETMAVLNPICCDCGMRLNVYTITDEDIEATKRGLAAP